MKNNELAYYRSMRKYVGNLFKELIHIYHNELKVDDFEIGREYINTLQLIDKKIAEMQSNLEKQDN